MQTKVRNHFQFCKKKGLKFGYLIYIMYLCRQISRYDSNYLQVMKQPLVSVIVPNYNHARFLNERIDSILNQTYKKFEIIILDDKSTDSSIDIINQYRNNHHVSKVILNDHNSGSPFKQWAKGIEAAKGELIWIAESDDSALPIFLENLVIELVNNPKAALAFSHSIFMDTESRIIDRDLHTNSGNSIIRHDGKIFARKTMTKRCYIYNASMVVFHRTAYNKIEKSTYQQFKSCGDWAFWTAMCQQGDVIEVCNKFSKFRVNQEGATINASRTGNDWNEVSFILAYFIELLKLKGFNLILFRGKWTRDLQLSRVNDKQYLVNKYPMVFGGSKIDIFLYRLSEFLIRTFRGVI
ncbi:Glycosyl transferase family 2 [Xylanibacter ruminicola]|nr:Glycosyl transferase family 2 [Xylanibacter ruminicola]